ncbi:MAG: lipid IV(A) 3-deoxy-D-manno-octulosonic acid transferase [Gammaproteobacteria bacterium]|nr:lipid IV(A) 3-deoxy-D-manno-octulosonic acid transferase [Gammaproteobacteria bacterium]MDH5591294.1 lipid IV(A) 3-deoxy-D-manno-octulosonic acid transferase [Gammaproteobacteria bacterium]
MKTLYTTLFILGLPFILLRLIWRGIRAPAYWRRWSERFGAGPTLDDKSPVIWIHAVSVGEAEATRPLVKSLQTEFPHYQLLITTMTPTGSERVKLLYGDSVTHCYLPYDLPFAINKFLDRVHPQFGIVMETEIWPNLLAVCEQRSVPLILANARMSERSVKGYARFPKFTKTILKSFRAIAAQGEDDRKRFKQLGADGNHVHAIGNLKYEVSLPASLKEQAEAMRSMWDSNRPVWIAASTHEGEEEIILNASRQIRSVFPNLLLIIVPRHPERFDRVTALAQRSGFKTLRRSENLPCPSTVQVLVVDTMGELPLFYAASDVAFIGGSLVPHGGHNLLEPAVLGRAIVIGPHFFNFNEISKQFLKAKAAKKVIDTISLAETVIGLLQNSDQRAQMGEASLQLIAKSQGASKRLINLIHYYITRHV